MARTHRRPLAGAVVVALAVAAPPAPAATPIPDAEYAGSTRQNREFRLVTAATPRRVARIRFDWRLRSCQRARSGVRGSFTLRRAIVRAGGRFRDRASRSQRLRATAGFGGGTQRVTARVRGRFIRQDLVRGVLRLTVVVRNRAGLTIDRCATERAIRWSARLLGTDPGH